MTSILQLQLILACMLHIGVWGVHNVNPCNSNDDATTAPPGNANRLWPAGIITYRMNRLLSKNIKMAIEKEIRQWELHSCIKFVPHVTVDHPAFVFFEPGDNNCAFFGKIDGRKKHKVSLSHLVSTNQTALNIIFAKMIGIRNSTLLFSDSFWSPDPRTTSHHRVTKKSNTPNATTVAQNKKSPLCKEIKACGDSFIINSDDGLKQHLITSPGYPAGYEQELDCVWSIYNTDRRPLNISFKKSSLQPYTCYDCSCGDYVDIIRMDTKGDQELGWERLCHSEDFQNIKYTNASKIIIQFHSNREISGKGFIANITWREVPSTDECTLANGGCEHTCIPASLTNASTRTCKCNSGFELSSNDGASCKDINECRVNNGGCSQQCVNTLGGYYCKCQPGYSLYPDNVTCRECMETYTNRTRVVVDSPHFPGVYSAHHNCVWKIESETPQFYKLSFSSFHLNYSPNCTVDFLKISDKTNKLKLPKLCGVHHDVVIVSRTAELTIHFKTKARGGTGFRLVYQQVEKQPRYIQIDNKKIDGSTYRN